MLQPVKDENTYFYSVGQLSFTYDIDLGKVVCNTQPAFFRAIEHFARRNFIIDWSLSRPINRILYVLPSENISREELKQLIIDDIYEVTDLNKEKRIKEKEEYVEENTTMNNRTGKPITMKYLSTWFLKLKDKKYTRQYVADFFNSFNIEDVRRDGALFYVKNEPKKVMIEHGELALRKLFKKGTLIRLTKEQLKAKMEEHNKDKNPEEEK